MRRRHTGQGLPRRGLRASCRIDPLLLLATIGLIAASIYTVGTATQDDIQGDPNYFAYRQAGYAAVGFVLMLLITRFDYSRLREWKLGIYAFLIGSILLVYALGFSARGSRRAIEFAFFNFQASELGKLLLIVALAGFAVDRMRRLDDARPPAGGAAGGDPGDARGRTAGPRLGLVYLASCSGDPVRRRHPLDPLRGARRAGGGRRSRRARGGACGRRRGAQAVPEGPPDGIPQPRRNPADEGYQINQSLTAIGSGGKTGRGDQATQTKLDFLPEHHTDFMFSVVGEEFGFVGAALVLSLFALLIWRALRILTMAKNFYGALVAGGITAMLMFQVFVNVGMTIAIMPITGIPLPLMSYGGSSVITTLWQ